MYQLLIIVILLLISLLSINSLQSNQLSALQKIADDLNQPWNLSNDNAICQGNVGTIGCDSTQTFVIYLSISDPGAPSLIPTQSLFVLTSLQELVIGQNANVNASFWTSAGSFINLRKLTIYSMGTEAMPANIGEYLPPSLYYLENQICDYSIPESLFISSQLKNLIIGVGNPTDIDIYPNGISTESPLTSLSIMSRGSLDMIGTNFLHLTTLIVTFKGTVPPLYQSYATWPVLANLKIYFESSLPSISFPNDIFSITTLENLYFQAENKISTIPSFDFSSCTFLKSIHIKTMNALQYRSYPGIVLSSRPDFIIEDSNFDFNNFNIGLFKSFEISGGTTLNSPLTSDYSDLVSFKMIDTPLFTDDLTDSLCLIKGNISMSNTGISNVPSCILCEWGSPIVKELFVGNPGLSNIVRSCPNFNFTYPNIQTPTIGGKLTLTGADMGWQVYNINNNPIPTEVVDGNNQLVITTPAGTGQNKNFPIKFHALSDPNATVYQVVVNYIPPVIVSVIASNTQLTITGSNFGTNPSVVSLIASQKGLSFETFGDSQIITSIGSVPYDANLTLYFNISVDGQYGSFLLKPASANPQMFHPLPVLYSNGGLAQFNGQFLTYDTSLMNMTVNGILYSNSITGSTSQYYLIRYNPIPAGQYPFEFKLESYSFTAQIIVIDPVIPTSCKGTPVCGGPSQGQCVNNQCQCIGIWKGDQCDTTTATIPPIDQGPTDPTVTTPDPKDTVELSISIVSIRELDFNSTLQREETISNWNFKQNSTDEKQSFYYESIVLNEAKVEIILDYFLQDTNVTFANEISNKSAGSIKYTAKISKWPFIKKTNQLQVIFSASIKNTLEEDSCSNQNIQYQDYDNVYIVDIQVNDKVFSSQFTDLAIVDGVIRKVNNVLIMKNQEDTGFESKSLIGVITPYHNDFIVIDPDFSLLVSTVDSKDREGSICSEYSKGLTKAQLAGIIVASSIIFIALVIVISYVVFIKNTTGKVLLFKAKKLLKV
ncbi:hypothetical protein DLAC_11266 [Tieghemostelium lacteum]|uniref:DUF7949 domain-containing protein n=1 Tax=Tieghemostelium lacteum TaxID=361077 RepID=A0A151Z3K3_TIELA|nr:hypothetical protein DLAC_11266 [Tieghemostelium lacteum]|eukprot:KYQ88542.1 hypothetical protein DLAC_11266 [Tieghemostelium lacteum]